MDENLVRIKHLSTAFQSDGRLIQIIDDVSFDIRKGEVIGIVGESGSGKSVTAKTIMRLLPEPPAKILNGEILFGTDEKLDILKLRESELCKLRG